VLRRSVSLVTFTAMRRSSAARRPEPLAASGVPQGPRRSCAAAALVVTAGLVVLATACGTSGRALREPNRDAVFPTRSTAAATTSTFPPTSLQLVAEGFEPGAALPSANGCGGHPPTLRWSGVPEGTVELALALVDFDQTDEARRIHWLVAGIPAAGTAGSLAEGAAAPTGAVGLANGQGSSGYAGPCVASGQTHTYNFMVFALPSASGLTADTPPAEAFRKLEAAAQGDIAYYTGTSSGS
jgi:phosphatidylethanolamine-binding protein (PEBP) family uncharacterized protein